jgi:tripartite ATP-independent transporter DctP family solute receptor
MKTSKKRDLALGVVCSLSLALLVAGCGQPAATNNSTGKTSSNSAGTATGEKLTLKLGHIQNVDTPIDKGVAKFAELVSQKTNGKVEIKVYPNSQLGNAADQLKGVSIGSQDMFIDGWSWEIAMEKDWGILSTAFVLKDEKDVKKLVASDVGKQLIEDLRTKHNVRVIGDNWDRGGRQLFSKKPIKSIDDLAGLKIRVPNKTYFETWKQLGASPSIVDWGETYGALQQGVVDAVEGGLPEAYGQKMYQVAKYVTMLDYMPSLSVLVMNEKKFASLSPDVQKAILDASKEAGEYTSKIRDEFEKQEIEDMKKEGVTFITPDVNEWVAKAKPIPLMFEADGAWSKGLYDKIQAVIK